MFYVKAMSSECKMRFKRRYILFSLQGCDPVSYSDLLCAVDGIRQGDIPTRSPQQLRQSDLSQVSVVNSQSAFGSFIYQQF